MATSAPTHCLFDGCSNPTLPARDKCHFHRYRTKCSVADCFNQVYARRLCVSHGGKKLCMHPQCTTPARIGDYCTKHSTRGPAMCQFSGGCTHPVSARGFCTLHGGGTPCAVDCCLMPARVGQFCWSHRNRIMPSAATTTTTTPDNCDALALMLDEWASTDGPHLELQDIDLDGILDDIIAFSNASHTGHD
ncbi:hypothetical protein SDRG_06102 [Saprolegnia diclina VS20]|uniref:Uncharacterized protein n=1 Tax=Saprolegnia diclina (strain VS20) TaxID=1156394 RepID=T0QPJ5_SAPDV|nr:hypothetical protein SDRG_06102 [Saprolegnia diclina VS20]EQC36666.1 hypothetical protein SDRG_06102 [Saprolegnia diclina VS20]|eukprot:XP_008610087.1 hypothetical protein SDRG_06102 [Saprolegnia diclina VS20]